MSFFGELKRRNVFRVGAAYIAVAWLIIQVVETLFHVFGLSDAAIRIVVILLAIGFLPVVVSAWAFELTPEGFKREADVDHAAPANRVMNRRLDRLFIIALALALGFFALDKFVLDPARDKAQLAEAVRQAKQQVRTAVKEEVRDRSIAVLAFQDLSPGGDQAYFGDGLAVDLINQLGNVPELRVTGKTSAFAFKTRDATIPEIGDALNVGHVLDGTVSKADDRVRISVQLVDAREDTQLWSQTYDRRLGDIFAIRDEITLTVFDRLTIELERLEQKSLRTDPEVYDQTLRAQYLIVEGGLENIQQAANNLRRALETDPDYVPALLASVYANYLLRQYGLITDEEESRLSANAVDRALRVDPDNGTALGMRAWEDWETALDLESAARRFTEALRTAPGDLELTRFAGLFSRSIGRNAESIALLERCVAADPENGRCVFHLAQSYLYGSDFDRALAMHRRFEARGGGNTYYRFMALLLKGETELALEELDAANGDFHQHPQGLAARAMVMHDLERHEESDAALQTLAEAFDENWRDQAYLVAQACAWTGQIDAAFEWLEKASAMDAHYGVRGYWFHRIMFLPIWRNLHEDPRWEEFRSRMNMSAERLDDLEFMTPPWINLSAG